MYELQPQDLQLKEHFYLEWVTDEQMEMLFIFFEVEFRAAHRLVRISTSPMEPHTSFMQSVFQLENYVTGKMGERCFGTIMMAERGKAKKNRANTSDMDDDLVVTFDIAYEGAFGHTAQNDLIYTVR